MTDNPDNPPPELKIKQEKLSPEREKTPESKNDIEKLLDVKFFTENDDKKEIEPSK